MSLDILTQKLNPVIIPQVSTISCSFPSTFEHLTLPSNTRKTSELCYNIIKNANQKLFAVEELFSPSTSWAMNLYEVFTTQVIKNIIADEKFILNFLIFTQKQKASDEF